ncbi:flagellar export chaperone FliS [Propionivibrio sp.]|jgi:flagellar protein FliS|uniref:flagellar export chaperone FliS n=1 Tax=Propionivibrio sp. TaxID=2212460 RepID=UPI0039E6D680
MFGKSLNPLSAYAEAGIAAKVQAASPHQLILLLFDGAATAIAVARLHIEQNDVAQKGKHISQAIDIISNGLRVSLDMEAGGQLAEQLSALYDYMCRRLIAANIGNDVVALDEVAHLLDEIHSAWKEIAPTHPGA